MLIRIDNYAMRHIDFYVDYHQRTTILLPRLARLLAQLAAWLRGRQRTENKFPIRLSRSHLYTDLLICGRGCFDRQNRRDDNGGGRGAGGRRRSLNLGGFGFYLYRLR